MQAVNRAMQKDKDELICGVLDIYGFEIFMVSLSSCQCYVNLKRGVGGKIVVN